MKISKAIEKAVNTTLWDGESQLYGTLKSEYSCIAISLSPYIDDAQYRTIDAGVVNMGLNTSSCRQFHDIHGSEQRQYDRALWLTWAVLMAKEQGV